MKAEWHLEIDRAVGAGVGALCAFAHLAHRIVDRVLHRKRHGVRQIGGLGGAHAEIEGIGAFDGADLGARVTPGATIVDVARMLPDRDVEVSRPAGDLLDLGECVMADLRALLDTLEIDLEPARRRTELGEILVELRHPAAEVCLLLDDNDLVAGLGRLDRGGDAGDAAADDQDRWLH